MSAPTRRQLAAGQVRSLRAMRLKVLDMAAQWDEVDQYSMNVLEELADRCEAVAVDLVEDTTGGEQ